MTTWKLIGIIDGAVMAAATAVGQAYPPALVVTQVIVEVGGVVATLCATYAHMTGAQS
jgi:hypothetical protein